MARDSSKSASPTKVPSRQFSITSFLPKGFASPVPTPSSSNSTSRDKPKRKRTREEEEEGGIESDEAVEEKDQSRYKLDKKGKGKAKVVDVIDLTEEDDLAMPPPPLPKASRNGKTKVKKKETKQKKKVVDLVQVDEMWVDKYAPHTRDDLSIHAKKLSDVNGWLEEAFGSNPKLVKYRRLLVLSGPSGAGKTATLRALAEEMGIEIVEWSEASNVQNANDEYRESVVHRFTSFLARAGMAPSLDFGDTDESTPIASTSTLTPSTSSHRRLILLEDLPNVSHFPTKMALRSALQQYLKSPRVTCPLVLIISEALARPGAENDPGGAVGGWTARDDSVDSRSVCGVEVLQHPACREIGFNPIAPTIMKKALNRILDEIYDGSSRSSSTLASTRPAPSTLDLVVQHSNGDIRSALMSLQFLATEGNDKAAMTSFGAGSNGGTGNKTKKRKSGSGVEGGDAKELLQFVTSRENSLFVFHALGKVLYNKRWGDDEKEDKKDLNRPGIVQDRKVDKLPKHLREEWDRRPSKVDTDVLLAEAPIDSDVFLTYLHHNFPQFTSSSIESCSTILDGLSDSDSLLRLESDDSPFRRTPLTSLYSFSVAVRTTLLGLPSPVVRNKQTLRKSELWENLKLQKSNEEGVGELVTKPFNGIEGGGNVAVSWSRSDGETEESTKEEGTKGLVTLRDRKSLMSEMIPWLGVIRPAQANPFLLDLAEFPPLDSTASSLTGDALGEKDIYSMEEEGEEGTDNLPCSETDHHGPFTGRAAVLEEVRINEEDEMKQETERREKVERDWFEDEDDIVD